MGVRNGADERRHEQIMQLMFEELAAEDKLLGTLSLADSLGSSTEYAIAYARLHPACAGSVPYKTRAQRTLAQQRPILRGECAGR